MQLSFVFRAAVREPSPQSRCTIRPFRTPAMFRIFPASALERLLFLEQENMRGIIIIPPVNINNLGFKFFFTNSFYG
jgi:hypothetical protein